MPRSGGSGGICDGCASHPSNTHTFVAQSQSLTGTDHGSNGAFAVIEGYPSAISLPIMQSAGTLLLGSPQQQEPKSQGLDNLMHE